MLYKIFYVNFFKATVISVKLQYIPVGISLDTLSLFEVPPFSELDLLAVGLPE
jgi:hypothetical protein